MQEVADEVWLLTGVPRYLFNVYLVGDVLIDAGTRWARRARNARATNSRQEHRASRGHQPAVRS